MDDFTKKKVNSYVRNNTKNDLIKMCKEKNIIPKGTKYEMSLQILGINLSHNNETNNKVSSNKTEISPLILKITKNEFGNFMHNETSMIFDPNTKRVIGTQLKDGNIKPLNRNDIETCQKFKFQYVMPTNLDPSPIYEILENSDKDDDKNSNYSDIDDLDDEDDEENNDEI